MKLIILSAGKGLRFLPITEKVPKGMVPVLGEPLLKHAITPYLPYVSDVIFVVNDGLGIKIKEYFGENYAGHKIFYKIQKEQRGTMDALMASKDLIENDELFCVSNSDDLLKEKDVKKALEENTIGVGISKKLMPKNYLGVKIENGYVEGFTRHDEKEDLVEDNYCNGFFVLDKKVFDFESVSTRDGELGLPHTLFANLKTYPLKAFNFESWETVNRPSDIENAEKFIKNE